jgi:hypothetical protein
MKLFITSVFLWVILICNLSPIFAADPSPVPLPTPQVQFTNEFTVDNQPSVIITLLKNFINGYDSVLGGFIFFTPNPLGDKITLADNSEIPGVTKYRNIFYQIAIPLLAIVIGAIGISKIGSDNGEQLKSFAVRLILTVALFVTVPLILSYSIQFNNLLVNKITNNHSFTAFLTDYLDQSQVQIDAGGASETYGIPNYDISLVGGVFKSLGKFIVQIFLFALTFLFLLGGFLYIGFQFVIRFATLLFLGVIYPIIIPFMLSEKTEKIVFSFFKSWFTFLIQQPAFVLGFAMATDIFVNILNSRGPSVGLLFFYTGFLFFLGGINTLVGRIFGDAWGAATTNAQALFASNAVKSSFTSPLNEFKRGAFGGSVGSAAGVIGARFGNATGISSLSLRNKQNTGSSESGGETNTTSHKTQIPQYSKELGKKGLQVSMENKKQGVVSLTGDAYSYKDPSSGLTSLYPTRSDALQDGVPEVDLQKTRLDNTQFIDLSSFGEDNPNPHNVHATREAQRLGKESDYAHVTGTSSPDRVKNFLELSKSRNEAYGIKGVMVKRFGNVDGAKSKERIIRLYTDETL